MRAAPEERVLLVSMPFGALERPSLALGLLAAHCERLGVPCDVRYLTFRYADLVGLEDYTWVGSDDVPYTAFAGEWIFSEALHGPRPEADAGYVEEVLRQTWLTPQSDVDRLLRMRSRVELFLDTCLREVPWGDYTFVGFTSIFQQNLASLALARRVKEEHPDVTIACGGANWEDVMGPALQRAFPFVDLAFSGEADESFVEVLRARRDGRPVEEVAGVSVAGSAHPRVAAERVSDLDGVPVPGLRRLLRPEGAQRRRGPPGHPARRDRPRLLVGRALALHLLRAQRRHHDVPQQVARPGGDRARGPALALRRPRPSASSTTSSTCGSSAACCRGWPTPGSGWTCSGRSRPTSPSSRCERCAPPGSP